MIEIKDDYIRIRQAVKCGYSDIPLAGGQIIVDCSYPGSTTRRGRIQGDGQICPTLMATDSDLFVFELDKFKKR